MTTQTRPTPPDSRNRESFGDVREAAEFVEMLERFERGELSSDEYRQYRLARGVYGQRQEGVQMIRVKIPQGVLSAAQLRTLADCADRWSRGYGHVTTRQNVQYHDVKTADVKAMLEAIALCGLTTREACSHTVRNIAGCPYAGVCADSPFDVTPYGEAVTRHFLRGRLGSGLPRKFKISISGCKDDCAQAAMNDIGIVARVVDGRRGFRILAGGGTATFARSAGALEEFLPAEDLLASCEAILAVYNAEGERKNLAKARLKWAIARLGWEAFSEKYQAALAAIRAEGGRPFEVSPLPEAPPPLRPLRVANRVLPVKFHSWHHRNVRRQVQPGYSAAQIMLPLGDISSAQLRGLADVVEQLGEGTVRLTNNQNILARWIRDAELPVLWDALEKLGLGEAGAGSIADVVSCPGAETCKIAVTASRGMAQLVGEHLRARRAQEGPAATADIKVSGCPNGCGQNHVAAIGLQGGVRKLGTRLVPQYHVTIGGGIGGTGATFGRLVARVPARRIPQVVDRLIAHFEATRLPEEAPRAFFARLPTEEAKALLTDLAELTAAAATPDDFIDLGSTTAFEVVTMDGECAA